MSSTLAAQQTASRTAYDCAAVRATVFRWTDCRSFDYLAEDVVLAGSASLRARFTIMLLKLGAIGLTKWMFSRISGGVEVFLFARQAAADDLVREALRANWRTQTIILGAGLDTSALRIDAERRAVGEMSGAFYEVDLPAMQTEKRRLATALVRSRRELSEERIIYVPCTFGENELFTALMNAGFDDSQPSVWIWSGVIHYLTETAVLGTLAEIKRMAAPGSKLFFDFISLEAYQRPPEYDFDKLKASFDAYGEMMHFGFREGEEHVRNWLDAQGITLTRTYDRLDMIALYEEKTGQPVQSGGARWSNLCVAEF